MFEQLITYFIPPGSRSSSENLRTARIFIAVLLLTGFFDLLSVSNAYMLQAPRLGYLLLANGIITFIIAFLFRRGISTSVCAHFYIGQHAASFCLQSWDGGGLESPSTAALFLLPATTMLIIGKRGATFWFFFAIIVLFFFYWYESVVGSPPVKYDVSMHTFFLFVSLLGTTVAIFVILYVYENEKNQAIDNLQKKHDDLVITQTKLIQSEKMASLGELTAGIAHEIQNPLNFVNNFSELSVELLQELKEETEKHEPNQEMICELVRDLTQNQEKIINHGNRASSIVKGMLEHSRSSSGEHALTDINKLADEFLRLTYHGLKAKDSNYYATLVTDFDPNLPEIKVVPQDIGRVFLNLLNNAFYAVQKKNMNSYGQYPTDGSGITGYEPTIWITTKKIGSAIQITIKDNGTGISDHVKTKIFQPFFTTKPTGEGTGLGLSLTYDIVTQGHNGTIDMDSKDGEGSTFMIRLPVVV